MKKITKRDVFFFFLVVLIIVFIVIVRDWDNAVKGAKDGWNENHPRAEK
ncbi:MAG TPA: hypothetical protein VFC67_21185 [Prolixibacteraceae bacterium]|nr:hypothetical protein [Prolixibacteraceae bacterium]